jgi:hypothetical protein
MEPEGVLEVPALSDEDSKPEAIFAKNTAEYELYELPGYT